MPLIIPYNKALKPCARQLRTKLTETELLLWPYLRKKQILGVQFYRQKIIGQYIADFYAPVVQLVIEIDGSQHFEPLAIEQDISRDDFFRKLGLNVLRFNNDQVRHAFKEVLQVIYDYVENFI